MHYHLAFKHLLYGITGVWWLRPCHPSTRLSCSYPYHPASLHSEALALFNTDSMSPSHPPTSCLCGCETGASWEGICAVCPALSALSPISRTTHSGAVIGSPLPGCILNTDIPHRASIHLQQEREGNSILGKAVTAVDRAVTLGKQEEQSREETCWPTECKAGCVQTVLTKGCWRLAAG